MAQVQPGVLEFKSGKLEPEISDIQVMKLALSDLTNAVELLSRRLSAVEVYCDGRGVLIDDVSPASPKLPLAITVDARDFLDGGDGFHRLEYNENGETFRWTGPTAKSCIRIWIDRTSAIQLEFAIVSLGVEDQLSKLRVEIDGSMYSFKFCDGFGMAHIISDPIPRVRHEGPTDVIIHVPHLFRPVDGGLPDDRQLGIAIHKLTATTMRAVGV